jgi:hypothetical protein
MSEFKLCRNGHYYQHSLAECPYCPKPANQKGTMNLDKTKIYTEDSGLSDTPVNQSTDPGLDQTRIFEQPAAGDLSKTQIIPPVNSQSQLAFPQVAQRSTRKLVGWLVSFTIDPNGVDFRLYEGRNSVGSDPGCDVVVSNDPAVSAKHLTILNRMGGFKFKDELSTNGTFVNNAFAEEGNLKDGDSIRIGTTVFTFRTVS